LNFHQPAQPYSFAYEVNDAPSYNNYGHSENSDGNVVTGSYRVLLPDGRTQIVNYRADKNGYVADVKYEGEAKYSEYNKPSAPVYKAPATPATYPAPPVAYKTPAPPAYKATAAPPAYKVPQAPIYKPAPASVAPVYKVPATPPVYKAPPAAAATPVYRAPATPVYKTPVAPVYKVPATTPVVFKSPTVISSPWTPIRSN